MIHLSGKKVRQVQDERGKSEKKPWLVKGCQSRFRETSHCIKPGGIGMISKLEGNISYFGAKIQLN
jgi:hypothetical protein